MAKNANDVVLTHFARTPFDRFGGICQKIHSIDYTEMVLRELIKRSGLKEDQVDEIFYGSALHLESGIRTDIPIRQALLQAGFPVTTVSTTINRACCSTTSAAQFAWRNLTFGESELLFVCGADNMQNVPLILDAKHRHNPNRIAHIQITDTMLGAGYPGFGIVSKDAGEVALEYGITREMQDEWAAGSHEKWGKAFDKGYFTEEIFPIEVKSGGKMVTMDKDQQPRPGTTVEVLSKLPTVYGSPTVTGGNAPGLNSGGSGVVMMTRKKAEELGLQPLAKVLRVTSLASDYKYIARVPAQAILHACDTNGLKLDDIEVIEINEAFAAMPLVSTKVMSNGDDGKWNHLKSITNINGGAVAIGHPIGGTGTRLMMTAMRELRARGGKYAVAAICGGLAQGDAVILEAEY